MRIKPPHMNPNGILPYRIQRVGVNVPPSQYQARYRQNTSQLIGVIRKGGWREFCRELMYTVKALSLSATLQTLELLPSAHCFTLVRGATSITHWSGPKSAEHIINLYTTSSLQPSMKEVSNTDGAQAEKFSFPIGQIFDRVSVSASFQWWSRDDGSRIPAGHLSSGRNLPSRIHPPS